MIRKLLLLSSVLLVFILYCEILICATQKKEGQETPCPRGTCCEAVFTNGQFNYNVYYCIHQWRVCKFSCCCKCLEYSEPSGYQTVYYNLRPVKKGYYACVNPGSNMTFGSSDCKGDETKPNWSLCVSLIGSLEPCFSDPSNELDCRLKSQQTNPPGNCNFESSYS